MKSWRRSAWIIASAAVVLGALTPVDTENAVANGDTRTLNLYHAHTRESISATYMVNGQYDASVLEKLNWFLRDWRRDEPTKMDPRLFDTVWQTYRESGSREPVQILSAYRSPETNAMLRHRSRAVAEFSQHMLGKAMDMHYTDVPMSMIREIGMKLQRGGVGYYPTAGTPFVHLDVGGVRAWPRMSYEQLAHLFPDGKTVHVPSNGQPLARYEEARAEVEARNGVSIPTVTQVKSKGFFAMLFGGGEDEDNAAPAPPPRVRGGPRVGGGSRVAGFIERTGSTNSSYAGNTGTRIASASPTGGATISADENNPAAFFIADAARQSQTSPTLQPAQPRVQVAAAPAPTAPAKPDPRTAAPAAPEPVRQVASLDPRPSAIADDAEAKVAANAPMPPRRPSEMALAALVAAATPLPPTRPNDIASSPIAAAPIRMARASDLPNVITTGSSKGSITASLSGGASSIMAFAPAMAPIAEPARAAPVKTAALPTAPQTLGLRAATRRRSEFPITHLDRSNFRILTSSATVATATPTGLGPTMTGLRKVAHAEAADLVFGPPAGVATHFNAGEGDALRTNFEGPAVRPLPLLDQASAATIDTYVNGLN